MRREREDNNSVPTKEYITIELGILSFAVVRSMLYGLLQVFHTKRVEKFEEFVTVRDITSNHRKTII